jgi:hypothetical protein
MCSKVLKLWRSVATLEDGLLFENVEDFILQLGEKMHATIFVCSGPKAFVPRIQNPPTYDYGFHKSIKVEDTSCITLTILSNM